MSLCAIHNLLQPCFECARQAPPPSVAPFATELLMREAESFLHPMAQGSAEVKEFANKVKQYLALTVSATARSGLTLADVEAAYARLAQSYRGTHDPNFPMASVNLLHTVARDAFAVPSPPAIYYQRAPEYDHRVANGDDFAGDAFVRWVTVGHEPSDARKVEPPRSAPAPSTGLVEKTGQNFQQAPAPETRRKLTDEEIMRAACNAADALDATRVSEMRPAGWHATTIFDGDTGLIRFGRLVESAVAEVATPGGKA